MIKVLHSANNRKNEELQSLREADAESVDESGEGDANLPSENLV
jgi:hypothetical protein